MTTIPWAYANHVRKTKAASAEPMSNSSLRLLRLFTTSVPRSRPDYIVSEVFHVNGHRLSVRARKLASVTTRPGVLLPGILLTRRTWLRRPAQVA